MQALVASATTEKKLIEFFGRQQQARTHLDCWIWTESGLNVTVAALWLRRRRTVGSPAPLVGYKRKDQHVVLGK